MRLAPYRSASASTASPAGVPKMMRSCAVTLKVPALRPAVVSLMVHSGESVRCSDSWAMLSARKRPGTPNRPSQCRDSWI